MNVDFVRFNATDGVELQGWLSDPGGDVAALHVHGMAGNGYENNFLDNLREMYSRLGNIAFFAIDARGRGVASDFRQGDGWKHAGSCFEIFEESAHDIQGAIDYLKSLGKKKFVLQGHSLGSSKVVNYLLTHDTSDVEKAILLAPTDMVGWANTDPKHGEYLAKAKQLIAAGKPEELVGAECWLGKSPLSAQTYPSLCEVGGAADMYGPRAGGALLGRVGLPTLVAYGSQDIGILEIDGSIDNWLARVDRIKNPNTTISVIEGASHGFRDYEGQLANIVGNFVNS